MRALRSALLALFVAAAAAAQSPDSAPPTLRLTFDWPKDLTASVTSTTRRSRSAETTTERVATTRFGMRVEPLGENLRIRFSNPTIALEEGALDPFPKSAQPELIEQLASMMPDYVVTRSGTFVSVHDLPGFHARFERFMADVLPKDTAPQTLARIRQLLATSDVLNAAAAEQWNAAVGAWVKSELEPGRRYTFESREPLPLLPGQEVRMQYELTAKRRLPCTRGGVERSCALLELRSVADPEDTQRALRSFLAGFAGSPDAPPALRSFAVQNRVEVVTEPDGLVPHRYRITKTVRGSLREDGAERSFEQVDDTRVEYTYPEN
ncbi:MAG: hypothetical protein ACQGVC_14095 [Myxococcota bacterium]